MNRRHYESIIAQLAADFEITFVGDTSLGGTRRTRDAMRLWFERFFRLFPDAQFELCDLAIDGWPWALRIFGSFEIHATVLSQPYTNVFVQLVHLRWGRIVSYVVYEDSLKFWQTAQRLAQSGQTEAVADPIRDA